MENTTTHPTSTKKETHKNSGGYLFLFLLILLISVFAWFQTRSKEKQITRSSIEKIQNQIQPGLSQDEYFELAAKDINFMFYKQVLDAVKNKCSLGHQEACKLLKTWVQAGGLVFMDKENAVNLVKQLLQEGYLVQMPGKIPLEYLDLKTETVEILTRSGINNFEDLINFIQNKEFNYTDWRIGIRNLPDGSLETAGEIEEFLDKPEVGYSVFLDNWRTR